MVTVVQIISILGNLGGGLGFLSGFSPLILKIFVNKKIEKRYNCKLNLVLLDIQRMMPLRSYFKYFNPGLAIGAAYLFRSQKPIEASVCLKEINYDIKSAPKMEVFICSFCFSSVCIALLSIFVWGISRDIFHIPTS